jgi:predicted lipoprotein with Yx(FWY)xxD motif
MQRAIRASRAAAITTMFHDRRLLTKITLLAVATAAAWLLTSLLVASAQARTSAAAATTVPNHAVVKVAKTAIGPILVDTRGRTLYLLTSDKRAKGASTCYAACAKAWPPLLTKGAAKAGPGARASLLGVAMRTDGTQQVTYNGKRLYLFVKDKAKLQLSGQKVTGFGGPYCTATLATKPCYWYALSPKGVANTRGK